MAFLGCGLSEAMASQSCARCRARAAIIQPAPRTLRPHTDVHPITSFGGHLDQAPFKHLDQASDSALAVCKMHFHMPAINIPLLESKVVSPSDGMTDGHTQGKADLKIVLAKGRWAYLIAGPKVPIEPPWNVFHFHRLYSYLSLH